MSSGFLAGIGAFPNLFETQRNFSAMGRGTPPETEDRNTPIFPEKTDPTTGEPVTVKDQVKKEVQTKPKSVSDIAQPFNLIASKSAGWFDAPEKSFYKFRKGLDVSSHPIATHQLATGRSAPLSAQIGYSTSLPLLAAIMSFINPKIGAGLLMAQHVGKGIYENTNPTTAMKDIAFAKSLKHPEYGNLVRGVGTYDAARKGVVKPSFLNKLVNLDFGM